MIEQHPFGDFVSPNSKHLILGSFPGKSFEGYDWFFASKRNQFWKILEGVYNLELKDKEARVNLFNKQRIAITDIILSCERRNNTNLDNNLINIVFNSHGLSHILEVAKLQKIFFTSRFVETLYKRHFKHLISLYPDIELITLPSPSPRYAKLSFAQKVEIYKKLLPKKG